MPEAPRDHRFAPSSYQTETKLPAEHSGGSINRRALLVGALGTAALIGRPRQGLAAARVTADVDAMVEKMLAHMSLTERIGQLFVFQALGTSMSDWFKTNLHDVKPGGVIFFGGNLGTPDEIKAFVHAIHESNHMLPPMIAIDQEGGPVVRVPGDPVPGAVELGLLSDDDVRRKSKVRAKFLAQYGFDINFAPVADVAYTSTSSMATRSFGSDPTLVADKVSQMVRGSRGGKVIGAAKHFPGHGRTPFDSHLTIPAVDISLKEWKKSDALPFKAAVEAKVEMVMLGHLHYTQWDDVPTSLSPVAIKALRKGLGFQGVIVTDDLGMGALTGWDSMSVLDQAVDAGVDLFLYASPPAPWPDLVAHLARRVKKGTIEESRINDSARRMVRLKFRHFRLAERAAG